MPAAQQRLPSVVQRTLLQHGQLVLPGRVVTGDVAVEDGVIVAIEPRIKTEPGDTVIDARGKLVLPGLIDSQAHFRAYTRLGGEDLQSGCLAAAAGGVTTVLEMPDNHPEDVFDGPSHARKLEKAQATCSVHVGFWLRARPDSFDEAVKADGVVGARLSLDGSPEQAETMRRWFKDYPGVLAVHAEDRGRLASRYALYEDADVTQHHRVRDTEIARLGTAMALDLASTHGTRLHLLHISCIEELALLEGRNERISASVTLPHLMLDANATQSIGTRAQCNPPLREPHHHAALWEALKEGRIDMVATDHCPHSLESKRAPYPSSSSGMPGIEWWLPLMMDAMHHGRCTIHDIVQWTAARPAQRFGLTRKGRIEVGFDADLTLVDPELTKTISDVSTRSAAGWSPYAGRTCRGWPTDVLVSGHAVLRDHVLMPHVRGRPVHPLTRSSS